MIKPSKFIELAINVNFNYCFFRKYHSISTIVIFYVKLGRKNPFFIVHGYQNSVTNLLYSTRDQKGQQLFGVLINFLSGFESFDLIFYLIRIFLSKHMEENHT